ncbi:hypothetical protein HOP50_06g41140 [Chloropicon primus]|uniref:Uncharacterized protein n=1 Tax=Chloropicon primus TaxID=1764295 RepID=A0A5B8MMB0_9CHLO|nr:hypothetical protein A3770_06p41050 [Chloropicon primus]UPR00798.1 hypothetical protein HOP50_06g41140 [Chloropicon primus]|eukprot:QDZ21587.1 hypothetical protein A3770_06p41050 [Chloropicon primus]
MRALNVLLMHIAVVSLAIALVGAEADRIGDGEVGFQLLGVAVCDYKSASCNVGTDNAGALNCMNEGYHSVCIPAASDLGFQVGRHDPVPPDTNVDTALNNSNLMLKNVLKGMAQKTSWLAFTLASTGGQYGIQDCTDAVKMNTPECAACGLDGCTLIMITLDKVVFGDLEYRAYKLLPDGSLPQPPPEPFYQTTGNSVIPTNSEAYVQVMATNKGQWVRYPDDKVQGVARFGAPILPPF